MAEFAGIMRLELLWAEFFQVFLLRILLKIGLINHQKQGSIILYREINKRVSIYENEEKTQSAAQD